VTSATIFSTTARVVGQMALQQQAGRTTRAMMLAWASALREAADGLERMARR
jgi:hypothetical protein